VRDIEPRDHREAVAHFRACIIGELARRDLTRGELRAELAILSMRRYRPPGALSARTFGVSTLERWYYRFRREGLAGLLPGKRSDEGRARALTPEQRDFLLAVRRENRSASASLILETLGKEGLIPSDAITATTLRRLYAAHDLPRLSRRDAEAGGPSTHRLRWQAERPNGLWHGDVCHLTSIEANGRPRPVRIHGLLDDCSRFIIALEAHEHEREIDMLGVLTRALRRHGAPDVLYLDNGSTYRGEGLEVACQRLGIALVHAKPYSPESRGKMERFWRTLREGCLDFLGKQSNLHDINVRLGAFLEERYQHKPHSGLMGKTPSRVYGSAETNPVSDEHIRHALTVRVRRRLRGDNTVALDGMDYQVQQSFLAKKVVTIAYVELDDPPSPVIEHEGRTYPLEPVDPTKNGRSRRKPNPEPPTPSTGFDPNQTALDRIRRRLRKETSE